MQWQNYHPLELTMGQHSRGKSQMASYSLQCTLLLNRAHGALAKEVHYLGDSVPFGMHIRSVTVGCCWGMRSLGMPIWDGNFEIPQVSIVKLFRFSVCVCARLCVCARVFI